MEKCVSSGLQRCTSSNFLTDSTVRKWTYLYISVWPAWVTVGFQLVKNHSPRNLAFKCVCTANILGDSIPKGQEIYVYLTKSGFLSRLGSKIKFPGFYKGNRSITFTYDYWLNNNNNISGKACTWRKCASSGHFADVIAGVNVIRIFIRHYIVVSNVVPLFLF